MLSISSLSAQDSLIKRPKAGSHYFNEIAHIRSPFMNTRFSTMLNYGQTLNYNAIILELDNNRVIGLTGDVTFLVINTKYRQEIRDWLSIYVNYSYSGRLGTETKTIILHGINTSQEFSLGWKIRLHQSEKQLLTGILELQNHNANFIDIRRYVNDLLNNNQFATVNRHIPLLIGVGGLEYARGVSELFGYGLSAELMWGDSYDSKEDRLAGSGSFLLDFNLNERYKVPVGLSLAFTLTSEPGFVNTDNRWAKMSTLAINYTKAKDFSLSLEVSVVQTPVNGSKEEPISQLVGLFSKFYF